MRVRVSAYCTQQGGQTTYRNEDVRCSSAVPEFAVDSSAGAAEQPLLELVQLQGELDEPAEPSEHGSAVLVEMCPTLAVCPHVIRPLRPRLGFAEAVQVMKRSYCPYCCERHFADPIQI